MAWPGMAWHGVAWRGIGCWGQQAVPRSACTARTQARQGRAGQAGPSSQQLWPMNQGPTDSTCRSAGALGSMGWAGAPGWDRWGDAGGGRRDGDSGEVLRGREGGSATSSVVGSSWLPRWLQLVLVLVLVLLLLPCLPRRASASTGTSGGPADGSAQYRVPVDGLGLAWLGVQH